MVSSLGIRDQWRATSAEVFADAGWVPFARPARAHALSPAIWSDRLRPAIGLGTNAGIEVAGAEPFRAILAGPRWERLRDRADP